MSRHLIAFSCALMALLVISINASDRSANTLSQARLYYDTPEELHTILKTATDIMGVDSDYISIAANSIELDTFRTMGIRVEVIHPDIVAFYRSRMPAKSMGAYRTLSEIYSYIDSITAEHPDIISTKQSIGTSIEGRDIWAFKVSDNPGIDEDEPEVLFTACIHAREVITPEVLINFVNYMADNYATDPDIQALVDSRELWFVMMVNPDGYHYNEVTNPDGGGMWRENRRNLGGGYYGVDLNRNYAYKWGFDSEGSSGSITSSNYRGSAPFSEPEAQALRDFSLAHDFVVSVYYHSKGNYTMFPWGYTALHCPDYNFLDEMADSIVTYNGHIPGQINTTLYPVNGGACDWHYGEQKLKERTAAFIIEVGTQLDGFWPSADRIPELTAENLESSLYIARLAEDAYTIRTPHAPALSLPDTIFSGSYDVAWSLANDPYNPVVEFQLFEMSDAGVVTDSAYSFDNWEAERFDRSYYRSHSGPYSFHSEQADNAICYMQSALPHHVTGGDRLRFYTYYEIESHYDYAYVEISTDGVDFTTLPGNITTNDDPNGLNRGNGITGNNLSWIEAEFSLANYYGQDVYFRIAYETDQATHGEGIYFDDFSPITAFTSIDTIIVPGDTSQTFSGKAENEYYYKVRGVDADGQYGQFSDIAGTYVMPFTCGDANGDDAINVGDAVFIINYIFKGGPAPIPVEAGDANGDDAVNVGDAVYVINYIFKGGPAPSCP